MLSMFIGSAIAGGAMGAWRWYNGSPEQVKVGKHIEARLKQGLKYCSGIVVEGVGAKIYINRTYGQNRSKPSVMLDGVYVNNVLSRRWNKRVKAAALKAIAKFDAVNAKANVERLAKVVDGTLAPTYKA